MAGPVLVGTQKNSGSAAGTSVTVTLPGSITAGNMLVAFAATDDTTIPGTTAISDTAGNTWTRLATQAGNGTVNPGSLGIYVALGVASGSYGIKFTNGTAFVALSVAEFSPNGQSGTDGTAGASPTTGNAPNPGTITTTNASDSIFCAATDAPTTTTFAAGTGYTLLSVVNSNTNTNIGAQYRSFSTTVSGQSTAFGASGTSGYAALAVAVKAAAGATFPGDDEAGLTFVPVVAW